MGRFRNEPYLPDPRLKLEALSVLPDDIKNSGREITKRNAILVIKGNRVGVGGGECLGKLLKIMPFHRRFAI